MKNNIQSRMCIRLQMPETNSSSSHSITIFKDDYEDKKEVKKFLEDNNIIINSGKTFIIPGNGDYGRNDEDVYNDFLEKVKYTSALIYSYESGRNNHDTWDKEDKYKKDWFEDIIKEFLEIDEILLEWIEDSCKEKIEEISDDNLREKKIKELESGKYSWFSERNNVDHDSWDYANKILFESKEALKDFLLSKNSYISCGECNVKTASSLFPDTIGNLSTSSNSIVLSLEESDDIKIDGTNKIDFLFYPSFILNYYDYEWIDFKNFLSYGEPEELIEDSNIENKFKWLHHFSLPFNDDYFGSIIRSEENIMPLDTLIKLISIYLIKKDDHYEVNFLDIDGNNEEFKNKEVYVPFYLEATFKYPFELLFVKLDAINFKDIKTKIENIGYKNGKELDQYFKNLFKNNSILIELTPHYDI